MGEFDTGGIEFSIARLDKKQGNDIDVGVKQLYHCLFFYSFLLILTFLQMVFSIISAENAIFLSVQDMFSKVKWERRYLSLVPTSKKLSQSMRMFLIVMLLHWLRGMSSLSPGLTN